MRISYAFCFVSLLLGVGATVSTAQEGGVVAVLDVKKVFDEHRAFQGEVEAIKNDIKAFEKNFMAQRDNLLAERKAMDDTLTPGTVDYKRREADLAQAASDLEVKKTLKQKSIVEREAKAYYDTYRHIVAEVNAFADANGIVLVLRYDSEPIDKDNRTDVIKGVNRHVVYQQNRDLTDIIVARVNQ